MTNFDLEAMERRARETVDASRAMRLDSGLSFAKRVPTPQADDILALVSRVRELEFVMEEMRRLRETFEQDAYTRGVADERKRCADIVKDALSPCTDGLSDQDVEMVLRDILDAIKRDPND